MNLKIQTEISFLLKEEDNTWVKIQNYFLPSGLSTNYDISDLLIVFVSIIIN